jgi:subtilisin-like proprotein convertase family protein
VRAITIAVTSLAVVFATSGGVAAQEQDGPALPSYDVRTASGPPGKASSGGATTVVGRTDGFLTAPSGRSAQEVARAFLRGNAEALGLATSDVADLAVTDAYTSGIGTRHLTFDQVVDGVAVYGGQVMANVDAKGRLINVSGEPVSGLDLDTTTPDLSEVQALHRARADVGGEPSGGFGEIESASLVAFPGAKRTAELAWDVWVDSPDGILYESVVSATTGTVLFRISRTAFDSASVWDNHPRSDRAPKIVDLAADPSWLNDSVGRTRLAGNNAHAYADTNGTNGVQAGEDVPAVGSDWLYPVTFFPDAGCPAWGCTWRTADKVTNNNAQVTGLFYLVNRFHDYLLSAPIGFDEASRNFEQVNASGTGLGNDRLLAEANDSSGLNNANMATPPDGSAPRMQQYFFDVNANRVSSSDSADVVFHEYTHGLTNRLVGNASGLGAPQSGAMGEAWSDFYANDFLVQTGEKTDGPGIDLRLGEYPVGPGGIRRQAMDCNPDSAAADCPANGTTGAGGFTFGDLGKFVQNGVHDNGEIWSQTLWDLREKIGVLNARAVITDGLRLTPNNPTFLQARDAILQATLVRGLPQTPVWQVFAARGMGFSATTPNASTFSAVEAFDLPVGVRQVSTTVQDLGGSLGDADGVVEPGETVRTVTRLRSVDLDPVTGVTGVLTAGDPTVVVDPATTSWPDFATPGTEADGTPISLTVPASAPCGSSFDLALAVTSSAGAYAVPTTKVTLGAPVFTTASPNLAIPDNNPTGVTTTITMPAGTVSRMEVSIPSLTHTWVGDLKMTLTSPTGTTITLMDRPGAGGNGSAADNFTDLVLTDLAPAPIEGIGNAGPITGRWGPDQPLSTFTGEAAGGTWTLRVSDNASIDTGTLGSWGLSSGYVCSTTAPAAPVVTTGDARDIGGSAATLAGTVDPAGVATSVAFEMGTTTAYGRRTAAASAGSGSGATAQSAAVDALSPGTTYHYRVLGLRDGVVVTRGADRTFTTLTQSCLDARAAVVAARGVLAQADATLATATQRLTDTTAAETLATTQVAAAKAKVAKAKKALKKAKRALRKAKATGTAAQVAKATKQVKKAKKALKRALARLKSAQAALTTAQAATAAARTAADQATTARATAATALATAEQTAATRCGSPG